MSDYTTQSISGYNSNPPADDGSAVSDNEVSWSKHKSKLGDPVKTLAESINTELVSAFGKVFANGTSAISTNTNLGAAQNGKVLNVTNSPTLTTTAAATLGDGWKCVVFNDGTGTITIDPNGAEVINGALTITLTAQYQFAIITCDGTKFSAIINTFIEVLDEDDMSSDSATLPPSQQSTKAYVDAAALTQADQAALEAETDENTYVPPDLVKHNPGVAKAWVKFDGTGATGATTTDAEHNISGVNKDSTGTYTISWDTDFSSADYSVQATVMYKADSGNAFLVVNIVSMAAGSVTIKMRNISNAAGGASNDAQDSAIICVTAFGDHS